MSKATFKKVCMKNFLSFGNVPTVVELDSGTIFGIIGDNRDIGGEGSSKNGVGKTSIYSAVIYGVFGKSIDKLKADEFINITNGNKMVVEVEFSKNGIDYLIKRGRKPNFLSFHATVDGETTDLTRDSMANTDTDIEKTLGMTYDIFMSTVFLSPHREAFYEMGAPAQRNIIEQMLSLDVLTERAEALKGIKTDLTVDIKVKGREIDLYETTVEQWETRRDRLTNSVNTWDENKTKKLNELSVEISKLNEIPVEEISTMLNELETTQATREKATTELHAIQADLESKVKHNEQVSLLELDIEKLHTQRKTSDEITKKDLEDIKTELEEIGDVSDFAGYMSAHTEWKQLERDMRESKRDISDADAAIERGETEIVRYQEEIKSIIAGLCPTCGAHYEDDVKLRKSEAAKQRAVRETKEAEEKRDAAKDKIAEISKRINEIDDVVKSLTDDDITDLKTAIDDVKLLESRRATIESQPKRDYDGEVKTLEDRLEGLGEPFPQEEFERISKDVGILRNEIKDAREIINEITTELHKYDVLTKIQLNDVVNKIESLQQRQSALNVEINPHTPELTTHLKEKPTANEDLEAELSELNEQVTHANYLIKLLTDSKSFIRRGILDRYIPFLNQKINGYLQEIGLSHVVEVSTDLNVELNYMGKGVSYYNLSRGERLRLNIATTLAFRDLMKMIGKSSNLLLIDEVLDSGLDESGIISTAALLKNSADDVFIITHRNELMETLDNRLTVIKENGFAHIELS